jgi:hypothetical protein
MNVIAAPPAAGPVLQTEAGQTEAGPLGEIIAAWPVASGALLLLGWQHGMVPAEGVAQLERRRADRGPFRTASWPRGSADDPLTSFIAAVRLPGGTDPRPGQRLALFPADGPPVLACLPDAFADVRRFAHEAARLAGPYAGLLARFLCDSFPAATLRRFPDAGRLLVAYLDHVALTDGCVEIMGAVPESCAFLQGWGPLPASGAELVLVGEHAERVSAAVAAFDRTDIAAPATGVVLVLPPQAAALLPALDRVHVLTAAGVSRRDVVSRRVLDADASQGHLRDVLPTWQCDGATAERVRLALRPRFDGHDTLAEAPQPVRAALDLAMLAPGGGVYLAGWLFDPGRVVTELLLRAPGGMAARLDTLWTRVQRADVSEAFAGDARFPRAGWHDHGFAVFVPAALADGAGLYLEVGFVGGGCAFVPVSCIPADGILPAGMSAAGAVAGNATALALGGVDLHKRGAHAVITRALGPLFQALAARPAAPASVTRHGTADAAHALVVPLTGAPVQPKAFLSQFLHDPLDDDEALVLVCGERWDDPSVAALRRAAAFLGLPATVLRAEGLAGEAGALDVAASATPSRTLLLVAPGAIGATAGWRRALRAAATATPAPRCACPTILYEDMSVRYGPVHALEAPDGPPWLGASSAFAGFPAALLPEQTALEPVLIGSLACCLVPRAALERAGGAQRGLATAWGTEIAFFLRLREAGVATVWVPKARLVVPETEPPATGGAATVGRLVDGWCLRAQATQAGLVQRGKIPCAS